MPHLYLMTRLYNTFDKKRACDLEAALLQRNSIASTYMPYRDTNEDQIDGDWKKEIFVRDIHELNRCDVAIGHWDGPAFDEGMGFEIGYALAKGKRVIIINDDFLTYGTSVGKPNLRFSDPLVTALNIPVVGSVFKMTSLSTYESDLTGAAQRTYSEAANQMEQMLNCEPDNTWTSARHTTASGFVEPGNSRILQASLAKWAKIQGYQTAKRFLSVEDIYVSREDVQAALSASKVFVASNGSEMTPGSSILCGLCFGHGIPFYVINDREIIPYSRVDVAMPTNLMIDVACTGYLNPSEVLYL